MEFKWAATILSCVSGRVETDYCVPSQEHTACLLKYDVDLFDLVTYMTVFFHLYYTFNIVVTLKYDNK